MGGRGDADGGVAGRGGDPLLHRGRGDDHADLVLEARLRPLLDEADALAARMELEDRVRLGGADTRHFSREVRLVEAREDLLDDLAAIHALESGQRVLASGIVGGQQHHLLVAELLGQSASGFMQIVVLPARHIVVLVAGLAREIGGARVGAHEDAAAFQNGGDRGYGHVGEDDAGEELHLVSLQPLLDDLLAISGL